ncbi:hypothetical protein GOP47_0006481 [Adiantum capillus-veneris]|uniref:Uncharacterized protein n=1 Tax=Adiantum capillus-veneris TaxID=13818 RepID=A0A9D4V2Y4_ADICA|nr:hypothetical protein GOP47_0006481 [Adiantum capillus-veneris]
MARQQVLVPRMPLHVLPSLVKGHTPLGEGTHLLTPWHLYPLVAVQTLAPPAEDRTLSCLFACLFPTHTHQPGISSPIAGCYAGLKVYTADNSTLASLRKSLQHPRIKLSSAPYY